MWVGWFKNNSWKPRSLYNVMNNNTKKQEYKWLNDRNLNRCVQGRGL